MLYYPILSKVLGSKYFEQLCNDDKSIPYKLNVDKLDVNFFPNFLFFETKKNVLNVILETFEKLEMPLSSIDEIHETYFRLYSVNQKTDEITDYLFKFNFDDVFEAIVKHIVDVANLIYLELIFESFIEKYELEIKKSDCRDEWYKNSINLFEHTIKEEIDLKYSYNSNLNYYCITTMEIKIKEDVFTYRQRFKCLFVKLAKELSKKHQYHRIEGKRYFDDN
jgi:hypothetical protein